MRLVLLLHPAPLLSTLLHLMNAIFMPLEKEVQIHPGHRKVHLRITDRGMRRSEMSSLKQRLTSPTAPPATSMFVVTVPPLAIGTAATVPCTANCQ